MLKDEFETNLINSNQKINFVDKSLNKKRNASVDKNIVSSDYLKLINGLLGETDNIAGSLSPCIVAKESIFKSKRTVDNNKNYSKLGIIKNKFIIENVNELNTQKTINENLEKINYCIKSQAGRTYENKKKINQDAHLSLCNIMGLSQYHIFGVLDGHGNLILILLGTNGHLAANFVKEFFSNYFTNINNYLYERVSEAIRIDSKSFYKEDFIYKKLTEDKHRFIKNAFEKANYDLKYSNIDVNFSGTTCNLMFIIEDKVICANVGDSRGFLMTKEFEAINLSFDHKPDLEQERKRIEKMGGVIEKSFGNQSFKFIR